jgi:hypothetical protein
MKLLLTILVFMAALAFSQTDTQNATQNSNRQTATSEHRSTITGCLTGQPDHYRLKDQNGVTNMLLSPTVQVDSYVGQFVTLVGIQSATPSTDTGTARPMPHFKVLEVHPASGKCK